ncbi:MAG TPA: DUF952 domain-containing protein [Beijerinckiaceae bacterium]|nr:DUF952 domain-containing protein [Beijerinckiaceae bacterium]
MTLVYKITPAELWRAAQAQDRFEGAPLDLADGYIHLSTLAQVRETAEKHFAGQRDLMLVAIETAALGDALKWEVSRGGALFPHCYGAIPLSAVRSIAAIPVDADGALVLDGLAP